MIYVASRASIPARGAMWRDLRRGGWPINSSWIDEDGPGQTPSMGDLWMRIGEEIRAATALVLYAEHEDLPLKGAFIEAGMALSQGKPVFVVLPNISNPLMDVGSWLSHPQVTVVTNLGEALHRATGRPLYS